MTQLRDHGRNKEGAAPSGGGMLPTRASPGPRPRLKSPSLLNRRWVLQTIATCKNHLLRFIYLLAFEKELGGQRRRDVNFKGFSWKKLTNLIRAGSLRPMPAGPTQKRWPQTRLVRGRMPERALPVGSLLGRRHAEGGQGEGSPKELVQWHIAQRWWAGNFSKLQNQPCADVSWFHADPDEALAEVPATK